MGKRRNPELTPYFEILAILDDGSFVVVMFHRDGQWTIAEFDRDGESVDRRP